jgi:hypothetical protein
MPRQGIRCRMSGLESLGNVAEVLRGVADGTRYSYRVKDSGSDFRDQYDPHLQQLVFRSWRNGHSRTENRTSAQARSVRSNPRRACETPIRQEVNHPKLDRAWCPALFRGIGRGKPTRRVASQPPISPYRAAFISQPDGYLLSHDSWGAVCDE